MHECHLSTGNSPKSTETKGRSVAAWSDEDVHGHEARKVAKSLLEVCVLFFHTTRCGVRLKARVDTCCDMASYPATDAVCQNCTVCGSLQEPRLGFHTVRKALQTLSMLRRGLWVCVFCCPADLYCECGLRYTLCRLAKRVQRTCGFGVRMSNCWRSSAVELRRLRWQRRLYRCCR